MKFLFMSWDDVQNLCEDVANKILQVNYRPNIIVAISRGGFPPARILCDLLDVKALTCIQIEYYSSVQEPKKEPTILHPLHSDVRGEKVLIVDDVADTGHSLIIAKNHVLERGATDVKIVTLHYKPWSVVKPDFYAKNVETWVVYAWEVRETVRLLVLKMREEGRSTEEIKKQLLRFGFRKKQLDF